MPLAGLTTVRSELVLTLNVLAASVPAELGLVRPAIESEAAVLAGSEHVPPLEASVIVTVFELLDAVAEQDEKPLPRLTAGVAGIVRPGLRTAVIVLPAPRPPVLDVVKLAVQRERALCCWGAPANETPVTPPAAVIVTEPSFTVVAESVLVFTVRV